MKFMFYKNIFKRKGKINFFFQRKHFVFGYVNDWLFNATVYNISEYLCVRGQVNWWRKPTYTQKTTDLLYVICHWQTFIICCCIKNTSPQTWVEIWQTLIVIDWITLFNVWLSYCLSTFLISSINKMKKKKYHIVRTVWC